ncbi:hypothetical protein [Lacrimispora sp. 38-1]|uniref:hypothetical protein n=1 Tax=Lacrimispora sp. 38-1 TaxID=3125778 RepID=UPI003CF7B942
MKEPLKKFWKNHLKPVIAVFLLSLMVAGIMIYSNLDSKDDPVKVVVDTDTIDTQITKESEIKEVRTDTVTEESTATENTTNEATEVASAVESKSTEKPEVENKDVTKTNDEVSDEKETKEKKSEESEATVPTTPPATITPVLENKYVPISEGWKSSETAKGDITAAQKADIDSMIESWKSGTMTDAELKEKIIVYLEGQGIEYMEVSITSKGYALYDVLPEVDLRDGGNLYSFVGTYSSGKQNPDGTNKTVCYNWSAFVF